MEEDSRNKQKLHFQMTNYSSVESRDKSRKAVPVSPLHGSNNVDYVFIICIVRMNSIGQGFDNCITQTIEHIQTTLSMRAKPAIIGL